MYDSYRKLLPRSANFAKEATHENSNVVWSWKYIRGAEGPEPWGLDEVDEARRVVNQTAIGLENLGVEVITYHDGVSDSQSENLERIVNFHNAQGAHDLDISVHFNSASFSGRNWTADPVGCEVWYKTSGGNTVAKAVVDGICADVPFKNRGPKQTDDGRPEQHAGRGANRGLPNLRRRVDLQQDL